MAHGWRIQENMEDWMRNTDKKIAGLERRPVVQQSSDIMGPTLGPYVQSVTDCNAAVTAVNGFFYVPIGTPNSPGSTLGWMVQTMAQADGYGIQNAQVIHDATGGLTTGRNRQRRFWAPGASVPRIFSAWVDYTLPGLGPALIQTDTIGTAAMPSGTTPPNTGAYFSCYTGVFGRPAGATLAHVHFDNTARAASNAAGFYRLRVGDNGTGITSTVLGDIRRHNDADPTTGMGAALSGWAAPSANSTTLTFSVEISIDSGGVGWTLHPGGFTCAWFR